MTKPDIVQKEVFGPIVTMHIFGIEAEPVTLARNSEYSLCTCIWTPNLKRLMRVAWEIEMGIHRMNGMAAFDDLLEYKHIPFSPGMMINRQFFIHRQTN